MTATDLTTERRTAWASVVAMMATSFVLVTAEFLPPSLLPPMAASLGITEGQAGQAVTATALVGFITAPTIAILVPRLDRRLLLVVLALVAAASNVLVAISGSMWLLLVARLLLGASIGGFWAMSIAVVSRLARPDQMGRAMMLVNTGTTLATVAGVPVGILLGSIFDWRIVFAIAAALSVVVAGLLWQILPRVEPTGPSSGLATLVETIRVPGLGRGLVGHILTVLGHFAAFTYIRVALEETSPLDDSGIALILIVFGAGSVIGGLAIGFVIDRHLAVMRGLVPLVVVLGITGLTVLPQHIPLLVVAVSAWGFSFGGWLIVVTTWIGRVAPDRMESGGGLLVAGFQLAIMLGAGVGGVLVDSVGVTVTLTVAAGLALLGGAIFATARSASIPTPVRVPAAHHIEETSGPRTTQACATTR